MLPNFICIGAQKSGTTTLWRLLDAHPDVFMAQPRETRFFCDEAQFPQGVHKYEIEYFAQWAGQRAVGEKCPEYLYVPAVARRIREVLGADMKFIVALRSPAQRAFSHYRHNLAMLRESRSFDEALRDEAETARQGSAAAVPYGYLARGYYAQQLQNYLALFARDRLLIVDFEREIAADQRALAARLCDFLGVARVYPEGLPFQEGHPRLERLTVRIGEDGEPPAPYVEIAQKDFRILRAGKLLKAFGRRDKVAAASQSRRIYRPSAALLEFARGFAQHKPTESALPRQLELELNRRYFADEIERLGALVPLAVDHWLH